MRTANHQVEPPGRPSLRELYLAHQQTLESFARRRVDDLTLIEDLCQQTWIGYERWRERNPDEQLRNVVGFLVNLLRFQLKSHYSRSRRDAICVGDDFLAGREERLLMQVFCNPHEDVETRLDLSAALAELKPKVRDALIYTIIDGLTAYEASYLLNVSAHRVYQLTTEGRRKLARSRHLASYGKEVR